MLHLIASIGQDKNNIVGYRILDSDSNNTKDVSVASLVGVLKSGVKVEGIELSNNNLKANNGSFERYPLIFNNIPLENRSSLIILFKEDGGFTCSDYRGRVGKYRENDVIGYCKKYGISNGKVVNANGIEYISSIHGEYNRMDDTTMDKKDTDINKNTGDITDEVEDKTYGLDSGADDKYRVRESYVSEILKKDKVYTLEDMQYKHYLMIMKTTYAEEKDLGWLIEEEDATLIKREVTVLADDSFIIEYNSIKTIKTNRKWLKLGKCFVTAIYKDGELDSCFAHNKEIITILEMIKQLHSTDKQWNIDTIKSVRSYGAGRFVKVDTFKSLIDSGFWYMDKKKRLACLELGVSRIDGCCYLVGSTCPIVVGTDQKSKRQITHLLKFKDLESGTAYGAEYLEKKFRNSKELRDMLEILGDSGLYSTIYKEVGPITHIINSYRKNTKINESQIMDHYNKTTAELGLVHPVQFNPTVGTMY